MSLQNVFWSSNLKLLRNRKKISQEDLATALDISRSKVAHHESDKHTNPPVEDLLKFSQYFKISIDSLLRVDLSKLGELKLCQLEAGNDVYMSGGQIRVLSITVTPGNKENIEFVPIKAKAGYLAGYNDPDFIGQLPKFSFPHLAEKKTYRIFPTEGDSMLPIPENCMVITEYVQDWQALNDTPCIVIMRSEQRFLFKMVTTQKDQLLLRSLNALYEDQQVFAGDVLEVWRYHSHITDVLPTQESEMNELLRAVNEIRSDVKKLKTEQQN
jgi:transcriptional regulator with XRE-family HTH domain